MKLFSFTLFMSLFAIGYSWVIGGRNQTDPAHPGKCVTYGLVLSPGEKGKPEGICMGIFCIDAYGSTEIVGCETEGTDPPCKMSDAKYPNEPYPKCCEKDIICPEGVKATAIWGIG